MPSPVGKLSAASSPWTAHGPWGHLEPSVVWEPRARVDLLGVPEAPLEEVPFEQDLVGWIGVWEWVGQAAAWSSGQTAWKGLVSGDGRTVGVARVWLERSRGKDVLGALASRAGRWTLLGKRPGL